MDSRARLPVLIEGHDAIRISSDDPEAPMKAAAEPQRTGRIKQQVELTGERGSQAKYRANRVQAIRDPKVELYCPVSLGLRINVAITLGIKSYRERKVYCWDAKEQKAKVL